MIFGSKITRLYAGFIARNKTNRQRGYGNKDEYFFHSYKDN